MNALRSLLPEFKRRISPIGLLTYLVLLCAIRASASAPHVYIAQNQQGTGAGDACINARPKAYFDTSMSWGSAANQIGTGSTVHLCGVFTATPGSDGYFTFQGGGISGSPLTLKAEPGAVIQSTWWGERGAIYNPGQPFVTADGAGVGIIRATANGTPPLANQQSICGSEQCSTGIWFERADNGEASNWIISNLYVHLPGDVRDAAYNSASIIYNGGQNGRVCGNVINDSKWGINLNIYPGITNRNMTACNNLIRNVDHGISVFTNNAPSLGDGYFIYGNDIAGFANWDAPPAADGSVFFHHDGIHVSPNQSGATIQNVYVYSNYIHGDGGTGCNSFIYFSPGTDAGYVLRNAYAFNNRLKNESAVNTCANGLMQDYGAQNAQFLYNTLEGPGDVNFSNGMVLLETGGWRNVVKGNIIRGFTNAYGVSQGYTPAGPDSDYNVFFQLREPAYVWGTDFGDTLAKWQTHNINPDPRGTLIPANVDLHSTFGVDPAIAAPGKGVNLVSLGLVPLNAVQPATGPWNIGASSAVVPPPPPPPPVVTITVSPATATLTQGQQRQFTAIVTGSSTAPTWTLGTTPIGIISALGLYTAPTTITTSQAIAIKATVGSASASATVTLQPPVVPPPPPTTCIKTISPALVIRGVQITGLIYLPPC